MFITLMIHNEININRYKVGPISHVQEFAFWKSRVKISTCAYKTKWHDASRFELMAPYLQVSQQPWNCYSQSTSPLESHALWGSTHGFYTLAPLAHGKKGKVRHEYEWASPYCKYACPSWWVMVAHGWWAHVSSQILQVLPIFLVHVPYSIQATIRPHRHTIHFCKLNAWNFVTSSTLFFHPLLISSRQLNFTRMPCLHLLFTL